SQAGEQTTLSFLLAGGWWRGNLGFEGANANYGSELGVMAALKSTYQDGHVQEICTDSRWQSQLSAIESASLYNGQREDRRLELTEPRPARVVELDRRDRKSTRLNSSHVSISYAVFCLKKKINTKILALLNE